MRKCESAKVGKCGNGEMREPPPSTVPPLLSAAGAGKQKAFDRKVERVKCDSVDHFLLRPTESILALTLTAVTPPAAENVSPAEGARRDR